MPQSNCFRAVLSAILLPVFAYASALPAWAASLTVTPTTLTAGTVGSAYSATLTATGGVAPYTWSITTGSSAPTGLALSAGGLLSGTPQTASGLKPTTFVVDVKDSSKTPLTGSATLSIQINPDPLKITTASLPNGVDTVAFSAQLTSSGGTGTVTWALASGSSLVAGLKLSATGAISGTPTASTNGSGSFKAVATDSAKPAHTALATIAYIVNPANGKFHISTTSLPNGTVGAAYSAMFASSGGTAPVTFKLIDGTALPAGLTLAATGAIAGTPTAATANTPIWVQATDSSKTPLTVTAFLNVIVNPALLAIATTSLPAATVGSSYTATLAAKGGVAPYAWSIAPGSMAPTGLSLSAAGVLSGKPTAASGASPTTFVVQVKDSEASPKSVTATVSLQINPAAPPLAITSLFLPPAYLNTAFSAQLSASGGTPPYTWSLGTSAAPPPGLALVSNGTLAGKPTALTDGDAFSVQVADSGKPAQKSTASVTAYVFPAVAQCSNNGSATAKLKGRYSVFLESVFLGQAAQDWTVGAFTADGAGNLTAGIYDSNSPEMAAAQSGTFAGTYSVGSDLRGFLTVKLPVSAANPSGLTRSFCVALDSVSDGVAASGRLVEDDETGINAAGEFELQPSAAINESSMTGTWVFSMPGGQIDSDGAETRQAAVGAMILNGSGKVTSGEIDIDNTSLAGNGEVTNSYTAAASLTGSYTAAATGRGTLALSVGKGTRNFVYYLTAANKLFILSSDPAIAAGGSNPVFLGKALLRVPVPTNAEALSGSSVFHSDADALSGGVPIGRAVEVGVVDWNGKGAFTGSADSNKAGAVTLAANNPISGTYGTPDDFGRVQLSDAGGGAGPVLYLTGPNAAYGLEDNPGATIFQFENQVAPAGGFTLPAIDGGYSQGTLNYIFEHQTVLTGEIVSNGDGGLQGTLDANLAGFVTTKTSSPGTYAGGTNGRYLFTPATKTAPSLAIYAVSSKLSYMINIDGGVWDPLIQNTHQ